MAPPSPKILAIVATGLAAISAILLIISVQTMLATNKVGDTYTEGGTSTITTDEKCPMFTDAELATARITTPDQLNICNSMNGAAHKDTSWTYGFSVYSGMGNACFAFELIGALLLIPLILEKGDKAMVTKVNMGVHAFVLIMVMVSMIILSKNRSGFTTLIDKLLPGKECNTHVLKGMCSRAQTAQTLTILAFVFDLGKTAILGFLLKSLMAGDGPVAAGGAAAGKAAAADVEAAPMVKVESEK